LARVQAAQLVVVVDYWHQLMVEVLEWHLDRAEEWDFEELGFVVLDSALCFEAPGSAVLDSVVLDSAVPDSAVLDFAAGSLAAEAAELVEE
jgi:hypothetical protein